MNNEKIKKEERAGFSIAILMVIVGTSILLGGTMRTDDLKDQIEDTSQVTVDGVTYDVTKR